MSLNAELIRSGHAWVYQQYCKDTRCKEWEFIEAKAKDEKNGLWSIPNPIPPWDFRHNGRTGQATVQSQTPSVAQPETGVIYHGNVRSKVFHAPSCKDYDCKNCTAILKSKEEAVKAGRQSSCREPCLRRYHSGK